VIGDNPGADGEIILGILDGLIVTAGQLIEDPTGQKVEIDRNGEHLINQQDDHPSFDEIEQAIRNPAQIWEQNVQNGVVMRHYIAQVGGKWVVVRVSWEGTKWTLSTGVEYGSKSEVQEYINDWGLTNRIYGGPL